MEKKLVNGNFIYDKNYDTHFSNGVIVGIHGNEFILNFYHEFSSLPESFSLEFQDGAIVEKADYDKKLSRNMVSTIVLNEQTVKALSQILDKLITQFDEMKGESKND